MEKLDSYRKIISEVLTEIARHGSASGQIDEYVICDEKTDNYILFNVGWQPSGRRQQGYPVHIRLKDGKVLIEWDGTDEDIAQKLIERGIAEEDIVFAFEEPFELPKAA